MLNAPTFAGQQEGVRVIVVSGSGIENVINEVPPEPFAVRVVDKADRPISGATVTFTAPSDGPGGSFPTGTSFSTISDEEGRALGLLYRPNSLEGSYMIQVRAEYLGQSAIASIRQSNVLVKKAKMSNKRKFVIAAVAGAGAAIAASALGGGASSGTSSPAARPAAPPTITFGTSSIGGQWTAIPLCDLLSTY
jgi:adhesin/invasin